MSRKRIHWHKSAVIYFENAISYIRNDSPKNAERVKAAILKAIGKLAQRPEIHPPDKFKLNNNGSYRAFELHRMRIGYLVTEDEIIIARIRHTSQEPLGY